jgi:hypothetical protein
VKYRRPVKPVNHVFNVQVYAFPRFSHGTMSSNGRRTRAHATPHSHPRHTTMARHAPLLLAALVAFAAGAAAAGTSAEGKAYLEAGAYTRSPQSST